MPRSCSWAATPLTDRALVVESESTGKALLPEGYRYYTYIVEIDDETLLATTYRDKENNYQRNQKILDKMMASMDISN
jgi:hypothetical protein